MQSKLSDLQLIIESNEIGKVARTLVPILESKILVLDSLLTLSNRRIVNLNTIISARDIQVKSLYQIVANDSTVRLNHESIIADNKIHIKALEKSLRRQKTKTTIVGVLGVLAFATVSYLTIIK